MADDNEQVGDAGTTSTADEAADTSRQLDEAQRVVAQLDERLRWALADLDNLRKRFEREVSRERTGERERVAAAWLPVVDDLDRALAHAEHADDPFVDGIRAVRDHALGVLARLGFPRFEDLGEAFDPNRHEAVATVEADAEPATIVQVVRPGYGADGAILRPASVVVARPTA